MKAHLKKFCVRLIPGQTSGTNFFFSIFGQHLAVGFGPCEFGYEVLGLAPVPPDVQSNKAQVVTIRNEVVGSKPTLSNAEALIALIDYFTQTLDVEK